MINHLRTGVLLMVLCLLCVPMCAESRTDVSERPDEVRIGWGDQMFETLMWQNPTTQTIIPENPYFPPTDLRETRKEKYRYSQHLFVEYSHHFNHWFSLGAMVDASGFSWDIVTRDGTGAVLNRVGREYCYNVVIMPTFRFTYLWHPNVNLYSGLGLGLDVNGGTEVDIDGKHTEVGAAVNFTILGCSVNYKRYFAAVEYGGLYALRNFDYIYMMKSRMFTASVGVRF